MPWDPIFDNVHGFGEHHSVFGQMIEQECHKLITQSNLSLLKQFFLNVIQSFLVKPWHIQYILKGTSGPGIRVELFYFSVHAFILIGHFDIEGTDVVLLPLFKIVESNGLGEVSGAGENSLNHFESIRFCY